MKKILLVTVAAALTVTACKEENKAGTVEESAAPQVQTQAEVAPQIAPAPQEQAPDSAPAPVDGQPQQEHHAQAPSRTVYYQCGDKLVEFSFSQTDDGKADMRIANAAYAMEQVIAASGVKYQNLGDAETYLWSKGEKATLRLSGQDQPECTETQKPKGPEKPYKASGNEPGWSAVIQNNSIKLVVNYGDKETTLPITADTRGRGARTVTAGTDAAKVVMTMQERPCQDSMSGEAFAHSVTVAYGGKTYQGCGKSLIRDVTWVLEDINNEGIIDSSHITTTFGDDGRVFGRSGCNNYNGSYTLEGATISVKDNMAVTMMACLADALMEQERKFLQTLPAAKKAVIDDTGALVLTGDGNVRLLFREKSEE